MTEEQLARELAGQLLAHFRSILNNPYMIPEIQDHLIQDLQQEMVSISTLGRNMVMQAAEMSIADMPAEIRTMFSEKLLGNFGNVLSVSAIFYKGIIEDNSQGFSQRERLFPLLTFVIASA